ncbi:hypothetical protein [Streptomyces sp. BA2]|uniref:hypothetical protein n=1 Tax=Streptomyces sp. BA2 TaxID=436595 RepID=UPI0013211822|nr:hypothetical protein [Streptomyces sp. BA2]MWA07734.1 hypothetical protein [Streptomyces sp. BA2]
MQTPFDGNGHRAPSLYCLNTAANTYDRYEWAGTKRPWFGDTPDDQGKLVGTSADPGLFGHWAIPWNTVDGTLCVDTKHIYLFNGTTCIYYTLEATGSYTDHTPKTDAVTDPIPISSVFGSTYNKSMVFPLPKVDAAFLTANKKIWFFGNNQCYLIDFTTHTPEPDFQDSNGKPTALNINATTNAQGNHWTGWAGLPADFTNGLTWAAPTLDGTSGNVQDSAHLDTDTTWCPVTPSTKTARMRTYTTPSDQQCNIPTIATQVTVELWGPGGGGSSANGGAGAYIRNVIKPAPSQLSVHVGAPGDYTSCPDQNLYAGGGGGAGGNGGSGIGVREGCEGGTGGSGGGGNGGTGDSGTGASGSNTNNGTGGFGGNGSSTGGSGTQGTAPGGGGGGSAGGAGQNGGGSPRLVGMFGGGGGGGGGAGFGGFGSGGTGGGAGNCGGGGGGGGGAQGPSNYPTGALFKPCADGDPRTPYTSFSDSTIGFGGTPGNPGGNGAARITW